MNSPRNHVETLKEEEEEGRRKKSNSSVDFRGQKATN